MKHPYPTHGRRRHWYAPWSTYCRCGLDAYPCIVVRTRGRQQEAAEIAAALDAAAGRLTIEHEDVYLDRLGHVRGRRGWSGGAR
jgi:hypothetical protein